MPREIFLHELSAEGADWVGGGIESSGNVQQVYPDIESQSAPNLKIDKTTFSSIILPLIHLYVHLSSPNLTPSYSADTSTLHGHSGEYTSSGLLHYIYSDGAHPENQTTPRQICVKKSDFNNPEKSMYTGIWRDTFIGNIYTGGSSINVPCFQINKNSNLFFFTSQGVYIYAAANPQGQPDEAYYVPVDSLYLTNEDKNSIFEAAIKEIVKLRTENNTEAVLKRKQWLEKYLGINPDTIEYWITQGLATNQMPMTIEQVYLPTDTPTPSPTPTPEPTLTKTLVPTRTSVPTKTSVPTNTPTPSRTAIPSQTPTVTLTPSPTPTPTPVPTFWEENGENITDNAKVGAGLIALAILVLFYMNRPPERATPANTKRQRRQTSRAAAGREVSRAKRTSSRR